MSKPQDKHVAFLHNLMRAVSVPTATLIPEQFDLTTPNGISETGKALLGMVEAMTHGNYAKAAILRQFQVCIDSYFEECDDESEDDET